MPKGTRTSSPLPPGATSASTHRKARAHACTRAEPRSHCYSDTRTHLLTHAVHNHTYFTTPPSHIHPPHPHLHTARPRSTVREAPAKGGGSTRGCHWASAPGPRGPAGRSVSHGLHGCAPATCRTGGRLCSWGIKLLPLELPPPRPMAAAATTAPPGPYHVSGWEHRAGKGTGAATTHCPRVPLAL